MKQSYVHVYTGSGKGKTTAAFGLAVRAAMAGKRVFVGQFVKDMKYSETKIADVISGITIEQLGQGCFISKDPSQVDIECAEKALKRCTELMTSGYYDVMILDEITIALYYGLISVESVIESINNRASNVEVIITGRYAPQEIIDMADLVTEMVEVKHYYKEGVLSRKGIDC